MAFFLLSFYLSFLSPWIFSLLFIPKSRNGFQANFETRSVRLKFKNEFILKPETRQNCEPVVYTQNPNPDNNQIRFQPKNSGLIGSSSFRYNNVMDRGDSMCTVHARITDGTMYSYMYYIQVQ